MQKNKKIAVLAGISMGLFAVLSVVLVTPGFTTQNPSVIEAGCLEITTIRTVSMLNIQTPSNLPQNFTLHCGWADIYEAELLYANGIPASPPTRSDIPARIQDGGIHIIVTDLKSKIGDVDFQKEIGNVDDQIIKEFESVKKANPSLNSQLVDINGEKAITYEPCKNCGKQTATFEDGTVINNSFGVPARIMFYDDTGKRYFLESNRPLSELIDVAKSLRS